MTPEAESDDAAFRALLEQVARDRGFATGNYKDGCLRRRVAVRMRARGLASYQAYATLLKREPDEYERLMDALTINVTRLYRDAEVWEAVANTYLPERWQAAGAAPFKAWSAGCASGEELYTVAALVHRHAERSGTTPRLAATRIIGTDIDPASLRAAQRGVFSEAACAELPEELRRRYFGATPPHEASAQLRALVEVQRLDLLRDNPPTTGLQLITCRNVLIYLDRAGQERILRGFHEALVPGGLLVLGKVETLLGPLRKLFDAVDLRQRVFRRSNA